MTPAEIAALRALRAAAAPGPWEAKPLHSERDYPHSNYFTEQREVHGHGAEIGPVAAACEAEFANAAIIVAAVNAAVPLCDEVERLRAIIEGRADAPTDAEIAAHAAAGGGWQVRWVVGTTTQRAVGDEFGTVHEPSHVRRWRDEGEVVRWIALDGDGRPCAWPVAS